MPIGYAGHRKAQKYQARQQDRLYREAKASSGAALFCAVRVRDPFWFSVFMGAALLSGVAQANAAPKDKPVAQVSDQPPALPPLASPLQVLPQNTCAPTPFYDISSVGASSGNATGQCVPCANFKGLLDPHASKIEKTLPFSSATRLAELSGSSGLIVEGPFEHELSALVSLLRSNSAPAVGEGPLEAAVEKYLRAQAARGFAERFKEEFEDEVKAAEGKSIVWKTKALRMSRNPIPSVIQNMVDRMLADAEKEIEVWPCDTVMEVIAGDPEVKALLEKYWDVNNFQEVLRVVEKLRSHGFAPEAATVGYLLRNLHQGLISIPSGDRSEITSWAENQRKFVVQNTLGLQPDILEFFSHIREKFEEQMETYYRLFAKQELSEKERIMYEQALDALGLVAPPSPYLYVKASVLAVLGAAILQLIRRAYRHFSLAQRKREQSLAAQRGMEHDRLSDEAENQRNAAQRQAQEEQQRKAQEKRDEQQRLRLQRKSKPRPAVTTPKVPRGDGQRKKPPMDRLENITKASIHDLGVKETRKNIGDIVHEYMKVTRSSEECTHLKSELTRLASLLDTIVRKLHSHSHSHSTIVWTDLVTKDHLRVIELALKSPSSTSNTDTTTTSSASTSSTSTSSTSTSSTSASSVSASTTSALLALQPPPPTAQAVASSVARTITYAGNFDTALSFAARRIDRQVGSKVSTNFTEDAFSKVQARDAVYFALEMLYVFSAEKHGFNRMRNILHHGSREAKCNLLNQLAELYNTKRLQSAEIGNLKLPEVRHYQRQPLSPESSEEDCVEAGNAISLLKKYIKDLRDHNNAADITNKKFKGIFSVETNAAILVVTHFLQIVRDSSDTFKEKVTDHCIMSESFLERLIKARNRAAHASDLDTTINAQNRLALKFIRYVGQNIETVLNGLSGLKSELAQKNTLVNSNADADGPRI